MPVSTLILAAALAQPAPGDAALPDILIPQLQLGMEKQQFYGLWPKLRAPFGEGCTARLWPTFRHGKLYSIGIENSEKEPAPACGKFVLAWAKTAFGKPEHDGDDTVSGACGSIGLGASWNSPSSPCGPDDVEDWASWEPQNRKYSAGVGAERKSGKWGFRIYPRN
jgi:hypothetical protein